jgi:predicted Zn-dependent protease with MMP-like domain
LPPEIAQAADGVVVRVVDYADRDVLRDMGIDDPLDLLGLYQGISLDQKSSFDIAREPDMVFLYRRPILNYSHETGDSLEAVVRHVVIHEIGHHFGFSDEDMEFLESLDHDDVD